MTTTISPLLRAAASRLAAEADISFPCALGGLLLLREFFPTKTIWLTEAELDLAMAWSFDCSGKERLAEIYTALETVGVVRPASDTSGLSVAWGLLP